MSTLPLRPIGFAITAVGALVAGVATTLVWISIGFRGDAQGVLDSEFTGTDLAEGVAVLVLAAGTLVGLLVARRARTSSRLVPAVAIVVFGIAIVVLSVWVGVRAEDRAIDEAAEVVAGSTGMTVDQAAALIRTESDLAIDVTTNVVVPLVGGALIALGGVTTVLWVRSDRATAAR
jgi:hypothetical protein